MTRKNGLILVGMVLRQKQTQYLLNLFVVVVVVDSEISVFSFVWCF